ncbi:MAG: HAD-IA family hydrolase [Patescibacteria group bacterium]|nr:HAD-IA family hydrolase [Patescibacteria group bacterium]
MPIKALFVDLGNVLIINQAQEISARFEQEYGLKQGDIRDVFNFIHTRPRTDEELNSCLADKGLTRAFWDSFTKDFYNSEQRNEALYEILKKARAQGVLVVFTTNNSAGLETIIDKFGLRDMADIIINSSVTGVAKPEIGFWQLALEETRKKSPNILPQEILVIDDSEINCASAESFGFRTIKYIPTTSDAELLNLLAV